MKSFKDLIEKKGNHKEASNYFAELLIKQGYIKTEVCGWEKPEYLEMFGLNPNADGVPTELYDECEHRDIKGNNKDSYGNNTGEVSMKRVEVKTGNKYRAASQKYLQFRDFKRNLNLKYEQNQEI